MIPYQCGDKLRTSESGHQNCTVQINFMFSFHFLNCIVGTDKYSTLGTSITSCQYTHILKYFSLTSNMHT
ncbi:hypothetical protein EB796_005751 [Bugula neritina]|uniref:Uncharacterized protein n=1 Tax=Bugula neritina TaxID=10212 RepID=A0A7J7KCC4_BUGNE|nr:hypothetical protein EB796_005751 [Bugula neritina]